MEIQSRWFYVVETGVAVMSVLVYQTTRLCTSQYPNINIMCQDNFILSQKLLQRTVNFDYTSVGSACGVKMESRQQVTVPSTIGSKGEQ
jgi:hypothetical protein